MERRGTDGGRPVRRWFVRVIAALLILGYAGIFGGLVATDAGIGREEILHTASAIVFAATLVLGLATQVAAPAAHPAGFWQTTAGLVGVLVSAAIVGDPNNYGGQAGPFDVVYALVVLPFVVLFLVRPAKRSLVRGWRPHPMLLFLALAGAVPLFVYGVDQALVQRNSWPPASDPHHNAHWMTMAHLALAAPLVAIVAAIRLPGWRLPAWTVSAMLFVLGGVSLLIPDAPSSIGRTWGALTVAGAIAFLVLSLWLNRDEASGARRESERLAGAGARPPAPPRSCP